MRLRAFLLATVLVLASGLWVASTVEVCACGPKTTFLGHMLERAADLLNIDYRAPRREI